MSIPKIREVHYTGDGCTLYECLNCYANIEIRGNIFVHKENKLTGDWEKELAFHICPYCGCKFEGFILEKKRIKDYDDPAFRTNPIRFEFNLLQRYSGNIDWEIDTRGPKHWVLKRKKEYLNLSRTFDDFEYKFEIRKKP